ncbi:hypothetical protein [Mucilaginibacter sp.]
MNDKEKRDDVIMTCNAIQGMIKAVNDQLRDCITHLSGLISLDNVGTRSNKAGAFNVLVDSAGVLSELTDVTGLITEALK